jgi:hypothetical protein
MSDTSVQKWKQEGHVYLWRYAGERKRYAGWHLAADPIGCRSLLALIDLMLKAPYGSRAEIRLSRASESITRVVGYNAPVRSAAFLVLVHRQGAAAGEDWSLSAEGKHVTISAGEKALRELRAGVEAIARGEGDYAIGGKAPLWFWWTIATRP